MQLALVAAWMPCLLVLDDTPRRRAVLAGWVGLGGTTSLVWLGYRALDADGAWLQGLDALAAHAG